MRDVIGCVATNKKKKEKTVSMSKKYIFYYKHGSTMVLCEFYVNNYTITMLTMAIIYYHNINQGTTLSHITHNITSTDLRTVTLPRRTGR